MFAERKKKMNKNLREERRLIRQRKKRARSILFAGIVISVLSLSGYFLKEAFFRPPPPPMAGNVIDIAADMGGFNKKEVRLKVGEEVTIRLESLDNQYHTDGGGQHQWAVDELGVDIIAQPLSTNYATFKPDSPGVYTFYCDICCGGRANPTMQGKLIVEA
jgi:cytochrome c oxidase subunit II